MIGDNDLQHLMTLARIDLDPAEAEKIKIDLNAILGYFEQLASLDTEGVEELARPVHTENISREDEIRPSLSRSRALAVAVETDEGFFKVPRTVDEG